MRINYGVLVQKPIFEDLISWFGNGLIMFLVFFSHSNIILSYPINIGSTFGLMSNDTQRVAWIILDLSGLQWLDQVVEWSARLWIYRLWRSAQELLSIESIFFDYSDDYLINPVYWSFCIIFFYIFLVFLFVVWIRASSLHRPCAYLPKMPKILVARMYGRDTYLPQAQFVPWVVLTETSTLMFGWIQTLRDPKMMIRSHDQMPQFVDATFVDAGSIYIYIGGSSLPGNDSRRNQGAGF